MRYTQVKETAFEELQMNAGIFVDDFNPATGVIGNILWATSGGANFKDTPEYTDFGEDIDNLPKNTMEMKRLTNREVKISGTALTVTATTAKRLMASADITGIKITPRDELKKSDFNDIWWIGDYSDKNGNSKGGFIAIHLMNTLSTGGFAIQSNNEGKGNFAFELTAHYSLENTDVVPYEVFIQEGEEETPPTYVEADIEGFEYGVKYYTRSGSAEPYTYTEVPVGSEYDSSTTYYVRQ